MVSIINIKLFLVLMIVAQGRGEQENIYTYWNMNGRTGWNVDVNMKVLNPSQAKFYALVFDFETGGGGFMGLQQLANDQKKVIFSFWKSGIFGSAQVYNVPGSKCTPHNENGGGVRCLLDFNWKDDHTYKLRMWWLRDEGSYDVWGFWVIDGAQEFYISSIGIGKPGGIRAYVKDVKIFVTDFSNQGDCQSPTLAVLQVYPPTINNGELTLLFSGDNGGSRCANGEVVSNPNSSPLLLKLGSKPISLRSGINRCLSVPNNFLSNGVDLRVEPCTNLPQQRWILTISGEIRLYGTSFCMDVEGPSTTTGTPVQIWECKLISNQKWKLSVDGQIIGFGNKCLRRNRKTTPFIQYLANMAPCRWKYTRWFRVSS